MKRVWTKARDGWLRRDIGDSVAALTVSRTRAGSWSWTLGASTGIVATNGGYSCALEAQIAADEHAASMYGSVAA